MTDYKHLIKSKQIPKENPIVIATVTLLIFINGLLIITAGV